MDEAFQRSFDNDSLYFVKACLPIIGKHALIFFPLLKKWVIRDLKDSVLSCEPSI